MPVNSTPKFCVWCGISSTLTPTPFAGATFDLCRKCVHRLAAAERGEPSNQIMLKALSRRAKKGSE